MIELFSKETKEKCDFISYKIINAAIEVHKTLGPGLLESVYEDCLCYELQKLELRYKRQVSFPLKYKDMTLNTTFRLDLLVEELVVVDLKTVEKILPIHECQLLTYIKLSNKWLGLLLNFKETLMKKGIVRIVYG